MLEPAPEHVAPQADCRCGLYSWRRPKKAWYDAPLWETARQVVGAVASWGRIQVHEAGFRAEYACIVVLGYHTGTPPDAVVALERIAARYRAQLVPLSELEQAASRHGSPIPDSIRPRIPSVTREDSPAEDQMDEVGDAPILTDAQLDSAPTPSRASLSSRARGEGVPGRHSPHKPARRTVPYLLTALIGIAALAIGLASLWHPIAFWAFGEAHRSDLPPVWGVSLLVVPAILLGIAVWRGWWTLAIDVEAWRSRRRREDRRANRPTPGKRRD